MTGSILPGITRDSVITLGRDLGYQVSEAPVDVNEMLADIQSLQENLSYLRSRGHDVLVLRVLAPAETDFPFQKASMIRDLETGRDIYIEPQQARRQYLERFQQHDAQIRTACDRLGVDYSRMLTSQPLETALFDLIRGQMRRGRKTIRRRTAGGRL